MTAQLLASLLLTAVLIAATALPAAEMSLEAAIHRALQTHPSVGISVSRIMEAEAHVQAARAAWHPHLSLGASYMRTDLGGPAFGTILNQQAFNFGQDFNDPGDIDDLSWMIDLRYSLYNGGADQARKRAAQEGAAAAQAARDNTRLNLGRKVVDVWLQAFTAREQVAATRAMIEAHTGNLATARNRLDAGTALKTDVLDMQVRLAEANEAHIQALGGQRLALAALGRILDLDPASIQITKDLPVLITPDLTDGHQHPAIAAAAAESIIASHQHDLTAAAFLPQVNAFASYAWHDGFETDGSGHGYLAGLELRWQAWDGGLRAAHQDAAVARMQAAREQLRQAHQDISLARTQAQVLLRNAEERTTVSRHILAQSEEMVTQMRESYRAGNILISQLIDAETARTHARLRLTAARADRVAALAALRQAFGLPICPDANAQP